MTSSGPCGARRGAVVWLTGLSGAGKSTIALALAQALCERGQPATVLDGDVLRRGLNRDLGFSPADRAENTRRAGEVAALLADAGLVAVCAFISPYRADRQAAREAAGNERFVEVHLDVPLEVCEQRDPKGLYRRARAGQLEQFTGISAPYEPPEAAELRLDTAARTPAACVEAVLLCLARKGLFGG